MSAAYDVVVIGGGNLGLWTAYCLAERGVGRIAVCDKGWAGFGATARSAGMVRAQGGTAAAIVLGRISRDRYQRLGREIGLDDGFTRTGYYVLAETAEEAALFRDLVGLRRSLGVAGEWVDADEGRRQLPWLDWSRFAGASFDPDDGFVHPSIAVRNITIAVIRHLAVALFERCPVTAITPRGTGWTVETARGRLEAERVVLAGGAAGGALAAQVGALLPVTAGRHHVVAYAGVAGDVARPFPQIFAVVRGFYLRPEEDGALVGLSRPEPATDTGRFALPFDRAFVDERLREVEQMVALLAGQAVSRAWAAAVDSTPDSLPVIDEIAPGCFVLAGGGHGMMWGPALGEKLAELMVDGTLSELPAEAVRRARFEDGGAAGPAEAISLPRPLT